MTEHVPADILPTEAELEQLPELEVDSQHATPVIKYLGGKREMCEDLLARTVLPIKHYIEPFFGGGAFFFHLYRLGLLAEAQTLISDYDHLLMGMYEDVRNDPEDVDRRLQLLAAEYRKNPEHTYYSVRTLWNQRNYSAAKNMFLRATCFNGLWRINKKGEMNAAWGKRKNPAFPDRNRLLAVSSALRTTDILSGDALDILETYDELAAPGTVVFADAPYHGGFVEYTKDGFTHEQQQRLVQKCADWSARGACVIYTNSDCKAVRDLVDSYWAGANVGTVMMRRRINCNGEGRGPVGELLVSSPNLSSSDVLAPSGT